MSSAPRLCWRTTTRAKPCPLLTAYEASVNSEHVALDSERQTQQASSPSIGGLIRIVRCIMRGLHSRKRSLLGKPQMSARRAVEKVRWSRMMTPASRVICTIAIGDDGTIARSSIDEAFTICVTRANRRRPKAHAQLSLVGLRSHDERLSGSSSMYIRTSSPAGQLLRPMLCT